jgi:hypothetical protein
LSEIPAASRAAVERMRCELGERGSGQRAGDDVPGGWTPVWMREWAIRRASARSGIADGGSAWATPVAKANAAAEWPDGNEVEDGVRT